MQKTFRVAGLDCQEEVNALRATVGKLPGVTILDFDLIQGTMTVRTESNSVDEQAVLTAVQQAGLELASVSDKHRTEASADEVGFWKRRGRGLMCWSSGALMAAGLMLHAFLHGSLLHALSGGDGTLNHEAPPVVILFYAAAVISGGWFVAPKAWLSLRRLQADMNLLMTVAVAGAMGIGQWLEAATVAFLFALSLLLESWSVARARRAILALVSLSPPTARYLCPHDGDIQEKPLSEVPPGVTLLVRPGERIPFDGVVTRGRTNVNQAPITGESIPVAKEAGSAVFAGTINEDGSFEFKATKSAGDSTLARIIQMVEQAQSRRAPVEQWVEQFARYYTPAMIGIAFLVAMVPPLLGGEWSRWFYEALVMLVIACPCALVISTPVSIVAALTAAARAGVLIKGGAYLEAVGRARVFALDKTGTLTIGIPEVQEVCPLGTHTPAELLARAAALEAHSEHPLAKAVLKRARMDQVPPLQAVDFRAIPGRGAEALIDDRPFWIGSQRLLLEKGLQDSEADRHARRMASAGHSVIVVGGGQHVCGLISVSDSLRPEAKALVKELKAAGVFRVVMLSGDNQGTAAAVGRAVEMDEVLAELLPEDKMRAIQDLSSRFGRTVMVGDGINDAPALAAASVGIAMGAVGSDAAIETADIALMSDDLARLPWLVRHARRSLRIIRQNIFFALGVKAGFMIMALLHVATLWMAIAADTGASLLVVFNALRLLRGGPGPAREVTAAAAPRSIGH